MKIYIRAMSEEQKEIKRDLSAKAKPLLRYLIKVILYPDSVEYEHWKAEITEFINDVDKVKGRNRWPKASFIKDAISIQNDMIDAVIKQVKLSERDLRPVPMTEQEILDGVEIYQNWLASTLSAEGIIDPYEAKDLIDDIVNSIHQR